MQATETLRCIYCQRTIRWASTEVYPHGCLHCGRVRAYTAATEANPLGRT